MRAGGGGGHAPVRDPLVERGRAALAALLAHTLSNTPPPTPRAPHPPPAQMSPVHKDEARFLVEHLQLMARAKRVRRTPQSIDQ